MKTQSLSRRPYGKGPRARVIASILLAFKEAGPRATTDMERSFVIQLAARTLFYNVLAPSTPRGTYEYRGDFRVALSEGATCIARRGAGRCFACGKYLRVTRRETGGAAERTVRVDYCDACDATEPDSRQRQREEAIRTAFEYLERGAQSTTGPA